MTIANKAKENDANDRVYARTHYEALMDIKYACVFNRLNESLYDRLDFVFGFVGLAGGSAVFASAIANKPELAALSGLVLALLSIVERLVGAARKSEQHKQAVHVFADLEARAHGLSLEQLDGELTKARAAAPKGVSGIAVLAFNANLITAGRSSFCLPVPVWSRFLSLIA